MCLLFAMGCAGQTSNTSTLSAPISPSSVTATPTRIAYLQNGECKLVSRNQRNLGFEALKRSLAKLPAQNGIIDGEIICVDAKGVSQFNQLLSRKGEPVLYAFDLLWLNGEDLRQTPLIERKKRLARLVRAAKCPQLLYAQHIERHGKGREAEEVIFLAASEEEDNARELAALIEGSEVKRSTAQRVIKKLLKEGRLTQIGKGRKKDPFRYFLTKKVSAQTPRMDGQNEINREPGNFGASSGGFAHL